MPSITKTTLNDIDHYQFTSGPMTIYLSVHDGLSYLTINTEQAKTSYSVTVDQLKLLHKMLDEAIHDAAIPPNQL